MGKGKGPGCFRRLFRRRVPRNMDTGDGTQTSVVASSPHIASDRVETAEGSRPGSRHTWKLWDDAYTELRERDANLVTNYEKVLNQALEPTGAAKDPFPLYTQVTSIIELRTKSLEEGEWKLKFQGHELKVKDLIEPVVSIVAWAKDYVGAAVEASPAGSLAWAGVCLLLPVLLNPSEQTADRVQALKKVAETIRRCRLRETLYQRRYEGRQEDDTKLAADLETYYESLKGLCVEILTFQATCAIALFRNTAKRMFADIIKLEKWKTLLAAINEQEQEVRGLEELVRDSVFQEELTASRERDISKVECITAMHSEVERLAELIETTKQSEVLKWLATSLDPSEKYNAARKRHGTNSGTGKWLIQSQMFRAWMEEPSSLLWLHGKAGGGKTILSSTVIHHLKKQFETNLKQGSTALAYYFFQFDKKDTQTTETMLRSLIANICRHRPSIPSDIEQWHRTNQSPSLEDLEAAFRTATVDFAQVFVIIDALDECPLPERYEVLEAVRRLNENRDGQQKLHLLLTSRREVDIASSLDRLCVEPRNNTMDLQRHRDEVNRDIATVIGEAFQHHPLATWSEHSRVEAMERLVQKAQGMFQYVALQIDALKDTSNMNDRQRVLDSLPDGLDGLYERILLKIPDAKQEFVHRALQWLACLDHEITVGELAEIIMVDSPSQWEVDHENSNIDLLSRFRFDPSFRFDPPERLLSMLQGLVVVSGTVRGRTYLENPCGFNNDCRTVLLSHFTVKEYLMSSRLKSKNFAIDEDSARTLIAESYLWYHVFLSEVLYASHSGSTMDEIVRASPDGNLRPPAPCFGAGQRGLRAADHLPLQQWTSTLKDLVTKILTTSTKSFHRYWEGSYGKNMYDFGPAFHGSNSSFPLLQYLVWKFDDQLPLFVLENSLCAINEKQDPYGTATLVAARFSGKHKLLKALLKAGADPYVGGPDFECALAGAISGQGVPLFDCILTLLEEPGSLRRHSEINYWPLVEIAGLREPWEDKKRLFEKLFGLSPDIKCHEPRPGRALVDQIAYGYCELAEVDFLIDRFGSSVEGRDELGVTALQWAVARASTAIIERLIQRGAVVDCHAEDWSNTINRLDASSHAFERDRAENLRKFQQIFGQRYKVSVPAESLVRNDVQRFMDVSEQDILG